MLQCMQVMLSGASLGVRSVSSSPSVSIRASSPSFSSPSSATLPAEDSGGYQGLAAIAGNLTATLSDMLGSVSETRSAMGDAAVSTYNDAQHAQRTQPRHQTQQAQHAQREPALGAAIDRRHSSGSASINSTGIVETISGSRASQATGGSQLERHASAVAQRLQERAAAAVALSETAAAPSSTVSGITEFHIPAAAPALAGAATTASSVVSGLEWLDTRAAAAMTSSEAAGAPSSVVSGITELQTRAAAAMALSEAAGASSSIVSGITDLAAAGAAMSVPGQHLQALPAQIASAANPFGLSSAHSVDGYALLNAVPPPSSILSGITELVAVGPNTDLTTAAAPDSLRAATAGEDAVQPILAVNMPKGPAQGLIERAAAAMALSDAVGAASSVVSGLTELPARRPDARQNKPTRTSSDITLSDSGMAFPSCMSELTDV